MNHQLTQKIIDIPWRVQGEIRRRLAFPYLRVMFAAHGISWGRNWKVHGKPIINRYRNSTIDLGDGIVLRSWIASTLEVPIHPVVISTLKESALIRVGRDCEFTGASVVASERIVIGDRVKVGAHTTIVDMDYVHAMEAHGRLSDSFSIERADTKGRPVTIQNDVFIGMNCLILKGVSIGTGSVIGAGSVVSQHVPPYTMVGGNPARVICAV